MRRRRGQVLIVAALAIALTILSTQVYIYSLSVEKASSSYDHLSNYVLGIERGTRNVVESSIMNQSGWIFGWGKRVRITIDHDDFDENQTDFPILVHLSDSSGWDADDVTFIFDEMQSDLNRNKIAITEKNGLTQLYVEVENWDDANEEAWLWVRVPEVSSVVDTVLYLYYDRDQPENTVYVGDPDSAPAERVWDNSFELVTHMRDDPDASHVWDSSLNGNDGVKHAANEPLETESGQFDGAQSFDGWNDDVDFGDVASDNWTAITVEAWIYHTASDDDRVVCKATGTAVSNHIFSLGVPGNLIRVWLSTDGAGGGTSSHDSNSDIHGTGRWEHVAFTWDSSDATIWFYSNGGVQGNATRDGDSITDSAQAVALGNIYFGASGASSRNFDGTIDEVRISSKARSAAWMRASYKTGIDDVLDFEGEETREGYFQDIWSSDLANNLGRWESFVQDGYRFGKSSLNATAETQSPYSEGIWIDWGTNGDGKTSAVAGVMMNVSGRGAELDLYYSVNATTRILISGSYVGLGGDAKAVTVYLQVQVDGSLALYGSKTAEVLRSGSWQDMASSPDYTEKDYRNGTYIYRFTGDLPGVQVPVRFQVYDRRGLLVVAEAGIQEG